MDFNIYSGKAMLTMQDYRCCVPGSSWLSAVVFSAFPDLFMAPLLPSDPALLPYFALDSAGVALRVVAAFVALQAASLSCLADAARKGNLTKSDTYKRLNTATLAAATAAAGVTLATYAAGDHMSSPLLLLGVAAATGPAAWAAYGGLREQGVDEVVAQVRPDADALVKDVSSPADSRLLLFYQAEVLLALAVGVALVVLPAAVVEAPEPNYTAETLARRVSGAQAAMLASTVNWLLLGAAKRGRLGASTFRTLNYGMAATTALVALWLAFLVTASTDTTAAGAAPVALLVGAPAAVYAYQGFAAEK